MVNTNDVLSILLSLSGAITAFLIILYIIVFQEIKNFRDERAEWREERAKLLDRIQAGSFIEYKAQERADAPIKRREKDPLIKKLESEPWA